MIKIHKQIKGKHELIFETLNEIEKDTENKKVGLIYLTPEKIGELFEDHFVELGKAFKIHRGWIHYMKKGSTRRSHQHVFLTGLYYLRIPKKSGKLYFDDTGDTFEPKEDDFYLFDSMRPHGISEHQSDDIRLAIAMELEEL